MRVGVSGDTTEAEELSDTEATTATVTAFGSVVTATEAMLERGATVGRYLILEPVGTGGMSVVYSAYDPELDRKDAIKLMKSSHMGKDGRVRLLREAQAMARLSHPNVAAVYDVGTLGDEVFMAMELVDGLTLRDWLREARPTWRQIVDVFVQVSRGLVAAHEAGLIHRDIKPSNILVDRKGRVRVVDFGVARAVQVSQDSDEQPAEGTTTTSDDDDDTRKSAFAADLTKVGSAVGTPAYMAPEQRKGHTDERTDQFSLCMTLYEALYGRRPTREQVRAGVKVARAESKAPRWLRTLIERGLRYEPNERFPSMPALLDELDRSQSRWPLVGASVIVAAGIVAAVMYTTNDSKQPASTVCNSGTEKLQGIWDEPTRATLQATFSRADKVSGAASWVSVKRRLSGYTGDWVRMHRESCEATNVRGEQSPQLLDARTVCLSRRLEEVRALVSLLKTADRKMVTKSLDAVSGLSTLADCADVVVLSSRVPLPREPALRAEIQKLNVHVAEARALSMAGQYKRARPAVKTLLEQVRKVRYRPLEAEVLLLWARLLDIRGDAKLAIAVVHQAAQAAEAARDPVLKVRAWLQLALVLGDRLALPKDAGRWVTYAAATVEALGKHDDLRGLVLERKGLLANKLGKFDEGRKFYEDSLKIARRLDGADSFRAGQIHLQLALTFMAMGDNERALRHSRRDLEIVTATRGGEHPATALSLNNMAIPLTSLGRLKEAEAALVRCIRIWKRAFGGFYPRLAMPLHNLGDLAMERRRFGTARDYYQQSLRVLEKGRGSKHADLFYPLSGLGHAGLALGRIDEARTASERAVRVFAAANGDKHAQLSTALVTLAEVELAAAKRGKARAHADRALTLLKPKRSDPRVRARLYFVLAQLLADDPKLRGRSRKLAADALAALTKRKGPPSDALRNAVHAWLAKQK